MNELIDVQRELHHWGAANRVVFDASKEHHIILSRTDPLGDDFRLLGIEFDCKLLMHVAIREVVTEASRRVKALLKTQRYYSKQQLIILYKQQILSGNHPVASQTSCPPGELPPRRVARQTNCPPSELPPGELPSRRVAPGELEIRIKI